MPIIDGKNVPLDEYSVQFRQKELAKNKYGRNNAYEGTHPDSLSDGDELGKGEKNGSIGSRTDIITRSAQQAKNIYSANNPYDGSKV